MPSWLIGLIAATCCVAIIAFLYMILAFRKITIVSKKVDYLVEDLTYKSEKLNSVVEAVVKLSNYVNVVEAVVKRNSDTIAKFVKNNAENIKKHEQNLEQALDYYKHEDKSKEDDNE